MCIEERFLTKSVKVSDQKIFTDCLEQADMKRRNLLVGTGLVATLAGCLGSDSDVPDELKYEQCGNYIIPVTVFPRAVKNEVITAIEDGEFETDDELILTKVVDIDQSYLRQSDQEDSYRYQYYDMNVETFEGTTLLSAEEVLPETRSVGLSNRTENDLLVDIRIEHENELLLQESIDVRADTRIRLEGENEYRYGDYRAEISVPNEEMLTEKEFTWQVDWYNSQPTLQIDPTEPDGSTILDQDSAEPPLKCK